MAENPVVLITGASRGMGAAAAKWLAKAGVSLALVARTESGLSDIAAEVEEMGGKALVFSGDVSKDATCLAAVDQCVKKFGGLNALINNAGILEPVGRLAYTSSEAWQYNLEVNLSGPFYLIKAAIPELRKNGGRVINISSGAASNPVEAWGAYCAAKAGLTHLTRVLAAEEPDITAISLRPGVVDTEMQALIRQEGPKHMPEKKAAYFQGLKKKGGLEPPHIPARVIAWLALHAPKELSGEFVDYTNEKISASAKEQFGEDF